MGHLTTTKQYGIPADEIASVAVPNERAEHRLTRHGARSQSGASGGAGGPALIRSPLRWLYPGAPLVPLSRVALCLHEVELRTSGVAVRNRVAMPVDDFPVPVLSPEDRRHPQGVGAGRCAAPPTDAVVCSMPTMYARSPLTPAARTST